MDALKLGEDWFMVSLLIASLQSDDLRLRMANMLLLFKL